PEPMKANIVSEEELQQSMKGMTLPPLSSDVTPSAQVVKTDVQRLDAPETQPPEIPLIQPKEEPVDENLQGQEHEEAARQREEEEQASSTFEKPEQLEFLDRFFKE